MKNLFFLLSLLFLWDIGLAQKHQLIIFDDISYNSWWYGNSGGIPQNLYHNPNVAVRSRLSQRFSLEYGGGLKQVGNRTLTVFLFSDETVQRVVLKEQMKAFNSFLNVMVKPLKSNSNWYVIGFIAAQKAWLWEEKGIENFGTLQNKLTYQQINVSHFSSSPKKIAATAAIGTEYNFSSPIGRLGVGARGEIGLLNYDPKIISLSLKYLIPIQKPIKK